MGSYVAMVTDEATTKTKYPIMVSVSVPGTNDTKMEVMLNPSMLHMIERASPSVSSTIYAYNTATGAYDIIVTNINTPFLVSKKRLRLRLLTDKTTLKKVEKSKPPAKSLPFQTMTQPIKLNNDKIRFITGIAEYLPSKTYSRGKLSSIKPPISIRTDPTSLN
jgi:hypothetical protein